MGAEHWSATTGCDAGPARPPTQTRQPDRDQVDAAIGSGETREAGHHRQG